MLSIRTKPGRLCDTPSRRELLTVGGLGLFGLSLPDVLRLQAQPRPGNRQSPPRADSVILLYLQGSPSHIDLWDPKPDAPENIRGEFRPIATNVPGVRLSETLPRLARAADKFALIRSLGVKPKGLRNHGAAIYMLMTGPAPSNFSPTGLAVPPSREALPSVGAAVARYRPAGAGSFGYVTLCVPVLEGGVTGVGQFAGLLGGTYDPFQVYADPTRSVPVQGLALPPDVTLGRL